MRRKILTKIKKTFSTESIYFLERAYEYISATISILNPIYRNMAFKSLSTRKNNEVQYSIKATKIFINKAVGWILRQQDIQGDSGITSWIRFRFGKRIRGASYPEVTGYIIPTLFNYAKVFKDEEVFKAALNAADFELNVQHKIGYFNAGPVGFVPDPCVFDSAQIITGLVRAYKETGESKYIESAIKACRWICSVQEEDGSWGRFNYLNMKRTYDTKVCEALLEAQSAIDTNDFTDSINSNLDYCLINQKENGWFYNCDNSFERNNAPLTHTIGYTIQGFLACYSMMNRSDLLLASKKSLMVLMHKFELLKKPLAGRYYSNWKPAVKSSCITGNAQLSICWMELYKIIDDTRYLNAAFKMNDWLKKMQYQSKYEEIDGGLPGSYPLWGDYCPNAINSWGIKYFIDALLMELELKEKIMEEIV